MSHFSQQKQKRVALLSLKLRFGELKAKVKQGYKVELEKNEFF